MITTHTATRSLDRLFYPRTVAVVGASRDATKHGGQFLASLSRSRDVRVFPVNERYDAIGDLPCYRSLAEIGEAVDHCVITVPGPKVGAVLADCARLGVGGATVVASGTGMDSLSDPEHSEVPFLGPNCLGFVQLNRSILCAPRVGTMLAGFRPGGVSVITQSAGLGMNSLGYLAGRAGVGLNFVVSMGNSSGVAPEKVLRTVVEDPSTRKVLLVLESDQVLARMLAELPSLDPEVPVYLLKLGRTAAGSAMVASHTGSLSATGTLSRDIAEQAGVVCVDDLDEAIAALQMSPRIWRAAQGAPRVAALSVSGGGLALFADAASANGVQFAPLEAATERQVAALLPAFAQVANPLDITGSFGSDMSTQRKLLDVLLAADELDLVVASMTSTEAQYPELVSVVGGREPAEAEKLAVLWVGANAHSFDGDDPLVDDGIAVCAGAGVLARAAAAISRATSTAVSSGSADTGQSDPDPNSLAGFSSSLTESQALTHLRAWGVPVAPSWAGQMSAAHAAAEAIGFPVVVKRDSDATHVAASGGVFVALRSSRDITERVEPHLRPDEPVVVARYLPGKEIIVSLFHHSAYGRLLMVGAGGVGTDAQRNVTFASLPLGPDRARALVSRIAGFGADDGPNADRDAQAAAAFLGNVVAIAEKVPRGWQLEMNPVTVGGHGAVAVDAALLNVGSGPMDGGQP